jgi:soluble lytic murein transglycosylase-like protein
MSSRRFAARSKFLLFLSLLSASAGVAALSTGQSGPAEEPLAAPGEAAAISSVGAPAPATVELPVPPAPARPTSLPVEPAADAPPPPADPVAAPDPGVQAPPPSAPAPAPAPPVVPAPVAPSMPADAMVPLDRATMKPILLQAAAESGLPPELVLAQAWAESSWQESAVSSAQAVGVLQITPPTVDFISHQLLRLDEPLDPLNPAENARMGTRYLRHLLERTDNNLRQALIAYNQGLGALRRNGPYPEAQRYADRVLALRPLFTPGPGPAEKR